MKKTVNHSLLFARAYEQAEGGKIPRESRPVFHLTPLTGWMNDPNGFCYYHGQYHLFYQYNPYDTEWDAMHWGHAVSHDLLHWTYLPAALAPDAPYDSFGCFSGSAAELPDGRHLLMYTGVRQEGGDKSREFQTQCIAVGDGTDYQKYEKNPVLDSNALPEGLSPYDFRDPKIWRTENGAYRCVVGARREDKRGVLLQYESRDGFEWRYIGVLAENDGRFGLMWECPDFFPLDGKHVLFVSPQDMLPEDFEYHNGNGTVCLTGRMDGDRFVEENNQAIDYGIDFYAPQTFTAPDGRRILIGWMGIGDIPYSNPTTELGWQHCLTVPCEVTEGAGGKLLRNPVAELEKLVTRRTDLTGSGEQVQLPFDLTASAQSDSFELDISNAVQMTFEDGIFTLKFLDEKVGCGRDVRRVKLDSCDRLRVLADKTSLEIFLGGGENVLSTRFYPPTTAVTVTSRGLTCRAAELRAMEVDHLGK